MRILGIDPALCITGYGVIDASRGKLTLVEAGIVRTDPKADISARLKKIYSALSALIRETKPDVAVLEKIYSHSGHPTTSFILGQARGVICLCCAMQDVPLVELPATRVKKAVVGKGLAGKEQVQRMVAATLGITKLPAYYDVTDALAMAIAHSYISASDRMRFSR